MPSDCIESDKNLKLQFIVLSAFKNSDNIMPFDCIYPDTDPKMPFVIFLYTFSEFTEYDPIGVCNS